MVHVLQKIHEALRPHGVLLDVHPLPRHPWVEIRRGDRPTRIGHLDDSLGIELTLAARKLLDTVVSEGAFRVEARRWFDWRVHYGSVEAWLRRRADRGSTSVIPPRLLTRVRSEMSVQGTTLVVGQRTGATALRRVP